jgi:hypothetical protein
MTDKGYRPTVRDLRALATAVVLHLEELLNGRTTRPLKEDLNRVAQLLEDYAELVPHLPGGYFNVAVTQAIRDHLRAYATTHNAGSLRMALRSANHLAQWGEEPKDLPTSPALVLRVDPGSAPPEEIADILSDISLLYRKMGGSGINFTPQGIHFLAAVES